MMQNDKPMRGKTMKHTTPFVALFFVTALVVDCSSADKTTSAEPKDGNNAAVQLENVKTANRKAARAMRDYAYAERAEFVREMKEELSQIERELDRLSTKIDSSSDAAKADAKMKLAAVREKWVQARNQLDRAESATGSTWNDVRGGFEKSYSDLKDTFADSRQWLSDKIEP
jgi:hypothetical protein